MAKIRLLLADDSVVMRQLLSQALGQDPELEVAAVAANGRIALERIPQVQPDVVLLDIVMPELDGLQTVAAIRSTDRKIPIIMVSSITERGASVTLEALSLGATDYWPKPKDTGGIEGAKECVRRELIPKIKALHAARHGRRSPPAALVPPTSLRKEARCNTPKASVKVVAIGASTGGPDALLKLLSGLSPRFQVPILIVQHMPPIFTSILANRLQSRSALAISECISGEAVKPGFVWIAPGDHHMIVTADKTLVRLRTHTEPPENFCRPSIDVLFRSVAQVYGAGTLAVLLTGMGQDGLRGCEKIHEAGGQILAQDEASSVVWGIPGAVVTAGLADAVLPLGEMALQISRRAAASPGSTPNSSFNSSRVPL